MKKLLLILPFLLLSTYSLASCPSPTTSCCGSYTVCEDHTESFDFSEMPFPVPDPSGSFCEVTKPTDNVVTLPVGGVTELPGTIEIQYRHCYTQSDTSCCPPPPPTPPGP